MSDLTLQIQSDELSESRLQDVARSLRSDLLKYTDADVDFPQERGEAHHKGEPITIGLLLLTAMTSGTAVPFFNVLKAYFERNKGLKIKLERADGAALEIDVGSAKSAEPLIRAFLGAAAE